MTAYTHGTYCTARTAPAESWVHIRMPLDGHGGHATNRPLPVVRGGANTTEAVVAWYVDGAAPVARWQHGTRDVGRGTWDVGAWSVGAHLVDHSSQHLDLHSLIARVRGTVVGGGGVGSSERVWGSGRWAGALASCEPRPWCAHHTDGTDSIPPQCPSSSPQLPNRPKGRLP